MIYKRYITQQIGKIYGLISFVIIAIVILSQFLKLINQYLSKGVEFSHIIYMLFLVLPSIFVYIAPITLFCALYFVYQKLLHDNEMIILENAGLSRYQLAMPAIRFALIITVVCYVITIFVTPYFKRQIQYSQKMIRESYIASMLEEKVFNSLSKDLIIYIDSQNQDGILNHVLVYDQRNETPAIITARTARITLKPSSLLLELYNGTRQSLNPNSQLEQLVFDSLTVNFEYGAVNEMSLNYSPEEMYINELFKTTGDDNEKKVRYELHQRFSWPLMNIALGSAAIFLVLSLNYNRQTNYKYLVYAGVVAIVIILLDFLCMRIAESGKAYGAILYTYLVSISICSLHLLKRQER